MLPAAASKSRMGKKKKAEQKLVFNVGGIRQETYRTTLNSVPDTRLYWIAHYKPSCVEEYDAESKEYFFDRHPGAFEQIINFYRTGKLHCPMDICGPMFEEELKYWGIDEMLIEPCCWMNYIKHRDAEASMNLFEAEAPHSSEDETDAGGQSSTAAKFGIKETKRQKSKWQRWKPKIWRLIDDPYSSSWAKLLTLVSMSFIVASIIGFCLETHPWGQRDFPAAAATRANLTQPRSPRIPHQWLTLVDYSCSIWFSIEFVFRLIFCPDRCVFFKTMLNIIDLLAIVPFYVQFLVFSGATPQAIISMWEIVKIFRIFRVFKLVRHVIGLKVLAHTLRASAKELLLLIVFLVLGVVVFSSLLHYAEFNSLSQQEESESDFGSIPGGFWWAVITMTTIGYGDSVPRTWSGQIVGALCAICGVLTISLPVPVIVNNFTLYYNHAQARLKLPKKKKVDKLVGVAGVFKDDIHTGATSGNEDFESENFESDVPNHISHRKSSASTLKSNNYRNSPNSRSQGRNSQRNSGNDVRDSIFIKGDSEDSDSDLRSGGFSKKPTRQHSEDNSDINFTQSMPESEIRPLYQKRRSNKYEKNPQNRMTSFNNPRSSLTATSGDSLDRSAGRRPSFIPNRHSLDESFRSKNRERLKRSPDALEYSPGRTRVSSSSSNQRRPSGGGGNFGSSFGKYIPPPAASDVDELESDRMPNPTTSDDEGPFLYQPPPSSDTPAPAGKSQCPKCESSEPAEAGAGSSPPAGRNNPVVTLSPHLDT